MICPPEPTPKRPRSGGRRRPRDAWSRTSVSPSRRRAYAGALRRLDGRELDDASLAVYLAELHDAGRALSSASMAVAAACFRAKLAGQPTFRQRADGPGARRLLPADRRR